MQAFQNMCTQASHQRQIHGLMESVAALKTELEQLKEAIFLVSSELAKQSSTRAPGKATYASKAATNNELPAASTANKPAAALVESPHLQARV